eukprot:TRINITY_DN793_c0_g1_i5.p1 TRINITY_DN793_c0_g1~~TRINITY_DN793_c0_g1_i5.p1  ORF type:complete len:237 (+),score=42.70 TRINITY_DN793_c0_g1_i5:378-1088(+)
MPATVARKSVVAKKNRFLAKEVRTAMKEVSIASKAKEKAIKEKMKATIVAERTSRALTKARHSLKRSIAFSKLAKADGLRMIAKAEEELRAARIKRRMKTAKEKAALKAIADAKKATLKKERTATKAIRASGSVHPFMLFIQHNARFDPRSGESWKALSDDQKQVYRDQAKNNLITRNATKQKMKASKTRYGIFVSNHFPALYAQSKKAHKSHLDAFKAASAAVSKLYQKSKPGKS